MSVIFCEATAIYGVILSIILANKANLPSVMPTTSAGLEAWTRVAKFAGYAGLWSGMSVGLTNLASGVCVGVAGSACALADAQDPSLFVKVRVWGGGAKSEAVARCISSPSNPLPVLSPQVLIVEIFGSALGIFGVIIGIIMSNSADFPV